MLDRQGQFIAGHWAAGEEAPEVAYNPATGEELASLASASRDQVDAAVAAAKSAYRIWSRMAPKERSLRMLKIADRIEQLAGEFAELEMRNCGKPIGTARAVDVGNTIDVFRFFAGAARTVHGVPAGEYRPGFTSMLRRDPLGVCVGIAPWNYPLMMASWKIAPVIAAGNTVVLKPSEHTPLTALKLAEVCAEFLPEGVVNVVTGNGPNVGARLVAQPDVCMVSLTGDVATGRKIMEAVAPTIKRTHFELGGKAPVIVLADADIPAGVEAIAEGGYYNAGQDCTAACRVYAHVQVHDRLVAELQTAIGKITIGNPDEPGTVLGPLASDAGGFMVNFGGDKAAQADIDRCIGKIGERLRHLFERPDATKVREPRQKGNPAFRLPQPRRQSVDGTGGGVGQDIRKRLFRGAERGAV